MEAQKSPWYLLTGLVIGFLIGLVITLFISPQFKTDYGPENLSGLQKNAYRLMIAEAFEANQDLTRARSRLELLKDTDPIQALSAQAQRLLGEPKTEDQARALAALASALLFDNAN